MVKFSLATLLLERVAPDELIDGLGNLVDCVLVGVELGLFRLDVFFDKSVGCGGALVQSPVTLVSNERHLGLEDRLVAAGGVGHADALSLDVLLHNALSLRVVQSLAHKFRVVLVVGDLTDHFV